MGVPCITLSGACHAHNVGVSLLHAVGLESEWIAHTTKDYVQLAIHHSKNLEVVPKLQPFFRLWSLLDSALCIETRESSCQPTPAGAVFATVR